MTPIDLQFLYKKRYSCSHYFLPPKNYHGVISTKCQSSPNSYGQPRNLIFFNISSRFLPNHTLYICSKGLSFRLTYWEPCATFVLAIIRLISPRSPRSRCIQSAITDTTQVKVKAGLVSIHQSHWLPLALTLGVADSCMFCLYKIPEELLLGPS